MSIRRVDYHLNHTKRYTHFRPVLGHLLFVVSAMVTVHSAYAASNILNIAPVHVPEQGTEIKARSPINTANGRQGLANIDFQRGPKGEGDVVIDLLDPNTPVDVKQQANTVVVRFLGNKIPQNLVKRLNVNDFATPVST
ncbi:MAG: hypothetical protein QM666_10220, partial [Acinetobacter sp.]